MSTVQTRIRKRLRLGRRSNGMLMTPEEFDGVTDWDDRFVYELIHGVVIVSPPPSEGERDPNDALGTLVRNHQTQHPQGSIIDRTIPEQYLPVPGGRRRADRVIWTGLGRRPVPGVDIPSIAVEFVSKRKRDRQRDHEEKRQEYEALGVLEYWIIDRFARIMTVYRKLPGEPAEVVIKEGEIYRTPLLPGFELPLSQLLQIADDWDRPTAGKKPPAHPAK